MSDKGTFTLLSCGEDPIRIPDDEERKYIRGGLALVAKARVVEGGGRVRYWADIHYVSKLESELGPIAAILEVKRDMLRIAAENWAGDEDYTFIDESEPETSPA